MSAIRSIYAYYISLYLESCKNEEYCDHFICHHHHHTTVYLLRSAVVVLYLHLYNFSSWYTESIHSSALSNKIIQQFKISFPYRRVLTL